MVGGNRLLRAALAGLVISLGVVRAAAAQEEYAEARAVARAIVDSVMTARNVPGMSLAIGRGGALVWSRAFGSADLELDVPAGTGTRFRVASVSKPLTAVALMRLVQEGRLALDDPIHRYVPRYAEDAEPAMTLRLLAGHLAGVRHRTSSELLSNESVPSVTAALDVFRSDDLLFDPGTRFSYSDYGWSLLSAAIEAASETDFLRYMRRAVFEPSGMTRTGPDHPDSIVPGRASFYEQAEGGVVINAPAVNNSDRWAATGFLSTAEDLVHFGSAMLEPSVLTARGLAAMFTSQRSATGEETGYGIGWRVGSVDGRRAVWHVGNGIGATCLLLVFPDDRLVLAGVANVSGAGLTGPGATPGAFAVQVARAFLTR